MNDVNPKGVYYKHSGRAPVRGVIVAIAVGAVVTSPIALVYAYFDALIPFVYLNIVAAVIVGAVAGLVTGKLLERGLVRNNLISALAGAAVGFIALYVAWAAWPYALLVTRATTDVRFLHLLTNPGALWSTILSINRHGAWRVGESTPTGLVLWIAWAGEAAIIVLCALSFARRVVADEPFCETCQRWCVKEPGGLEAHGFDDAELKRRLEAKDFASVGELGPRRPNDLEWFRLDLHLCPGCQNTATLTAKSVDLTREGGRASEKTVLEKIIVSRPEVEQLRSFKFDSPRPPGA
jgi:hypothetical protein